MDVPVRVGERVVLAKSCCAFGSITCHFRSLSAPGWLTIVCPINRPWPTTPRHPVNATPAVETSMTASAYPNLLAPLDLGFTTLRNRT